MEWQDQGVVLSTRRHGETSAIVEIFTESHGRHAGVVRGGSGRRLGPVLQPGTQVAVAWRARLEEQLGSFTVEPLRSRSAGVLSDRLALAGLNAICGLLAYGLPERMAYLGIYERTVDLMDLLSATPAWPLAYLQWEMALLTDLGFGLDLSCCAVTGVTEGLVYVSPRTGRAVTALGAGEYADRLLALPECMLGQGEAPNGEIALALRTTEHFLENNLTPRYQGQKFPASRGRLVEILMR